MGTTELTGEETAMREHMIHIHLSERRFEIEDFETPPPRELTGTDPVASAPSSHPRSTNPRERIPGSFP